MKKLLQLSLFLLPILVLCSHIVYRENHQLSAWKGGGLGMYTNIHYNYYDIWINNQKFQIDSFKILSKKLTRKIDYLKVLPSNADILTVAKEYSRLLDTTRITIEIWKPKIDINTNSYTRVLFKKSEFDFTDED